MLDFTILIGSYKTTEKNKFKLLFSLILQRKFSGRIVKIPCLNLKTCAKTFK